MKLKQAITTTSVTRNRNCTPYRHGPSSQTHKRPNFLKRWSKRLAWRTRASWGVVSNSSVTRCYTRTARIHVILLWSSNGIVASQITTWRIWCCTTLPRHISTPDGLQLSMADICLYSIILSGREYPEILLHNLPTCILSHCWELNALKRTAGTQVWWIWLWIWIPHGES